jgi:hypothetical protein
MLSVTSILHASHPSFGLAGSWAWVVGPLGLTITSNRVAGGEGAPNQMLTAVGPNLKDLEHRVGVFNQYLPNNSSLSFPPWQL